MIRSFSWLLCLSTFVSFTLAGQVQKEGLVLPQSAGDDKQAVRVMFQESYGAYKAFAFGHDELHPQSKTPGDSRNGWGATIVDSLSTMYIMGLMDEFKEGVDFSSKIDFSKTSDSVSVFETTIRYLGGLLSAYELAGGDSLLAQAKILADKLAFAWNGDLPCSELDFSTLRPADTDSNIAEAGTLILEWSTLSKHTSNRTYGDLATKSMRKIASLARDPKYPGLPIQDLDTAAAVSKGSIRSWGGGSDSYYEYLIKHARLSNTDDPLYVRNWLQAVDTSIRKMMGVSSKGDYYIGTLYGDTLKPEGSHLACFHGGNWLFGGKLLNNATIVSYGLKLVDGCWNTYASTSTGIGPEAFTYARASSPFYNRHGFSITSSPYILRPEVLESNFYAWRVTGDRKYQDRAKAAVRSFQRYLRTPIFDPTTGFNGFGYDGITNADAVLPRHTDMTESFWFAEVLKYLYLTFDDPNHISLDQYVFNTEAHPFKAPTAKTTYTI